MTGKKGMASKHSFVGKRGYGWVPAKQNLLRRFAGDRLFAQRPPGS